MLRITIPSLLLVSGLTAADAAQDKPDPAMARVERHLKGLTAGAPKRCLPFQDQRSGTVSADGVILYVSGRNRVFRNDVNGDGCNGLSNGDIIVTTSISGQLCEGDIVRTRAALGGMMTGSCSLGKFTPYTKQ